MDCSSNVNGGSKNPKRVAAGRRNQLKRKGLTAEGRQRLSETALTHQPWLKATGPRSRQGKRRSARNSRRRQVGELSVRELRSELAGDDALLDQMRALIKQQSGT